MSSMESEGGEERVDPEELDDAPPGSANDEGGAGDLGSDVGGDGSGGESGWVDEGEETA